MSSTAAWISSRRKFPPMKAWWYLGCAAVHTQHTHVLGKLRILRGAHAGVAEGAEILGGKERQATDIPGAAGAHAVAVLRADRLRGVLDEPAGRARARAPAARTAAHTARTGARAATHARVRRCGLVSAPSRRSQSRSISCRTAAASILKLSASISQNSGRAPVRAIVPAVAKKLIRCGDNLIAGADAERHQRQQQGIGTGGHADRLAAAAVGGGRALELRHISPEDELLAFTYFL